MNIIRHRGAVTQDAIEHLVDSVPFMQTVIYADTRLHEEIEAALTAAGFSERRVMRPVLPHKNPDIIACVSVRELLSSDHGIAVLLLEPEP